MRALACYVLIVALVCPSFARAATPTIQVQKIDRLKDGAFKIAFEDSSGGRTEIVD